MPDVRLEITDGYETQLTRWDVILTSRPIASKSATGRGHQRLSS